MIKAAFLLLLILGGVTVSLAQSFSSGSTGADGAFSCANGDSPSVQLPPSGVLNYTTVTIANGCDLTFLPNVTNTPVTMLATGAVTIGGQIYIGFGSAGYVSGPGGFYGGAAGQNGVGPGGGIYGGTNGAQNGTWVGPLNLVPIVGGSGGAGGAGGAGGGGGGALVIASSTSITMTGFVNAPGYNVSSGAGASGAVRFVSNSINVSGNFDNVAVARLEGPTGGVFFTGGGTPPVIASINPVIVPVNPPSISITSIGGYAVPSTTGANWKTVDLLLPTQLTDPIAVIVQGANLPTGAQASLSFSGSPATASPRTIALSGSSSGTFNVSGLSRTSVTVIFVVASFNTSLIASNLKQSGPDAVAKVELVAALGQPTKYRFLRADGSEVPVPDVAPELKHVFGM